MANECGTCTLCCKLPGLPEMNKPVNKWCKYAKPGKGCTVYDNRPVPCQAYRCAYLQIDNIDPDLRPDRCGAIFEATHDDKLMIMRVRQEGYASTWRQPKVFRLVLGFIKTGAKVVMTDGSRSQLFERHPRNPSKWLQLQGTFLSDVPDQGPDTAGGLRRYHYSGEMETGFL